MSDYKFSHDNDAVQNYISTLLKSPNTTDCAQLLLMAGVALNDTGLMKYAISLEPGIVNMGVPDYILAATDDVMYEVTGKKFSTCEEPEDSSLASKDIPN